MKYIKDTAMIVIVIALGAVGYMAMKRYYAKQEESKVKVQFFGWHPIDDARDDDYYRHRDGRYYEVRNNNNNNNNFNEGYEQAKQEDLGTSNYTQGYEQAKQEDRG